MVPTTPQLARTAELVAAGYSYDELSRLSRASQLIRLRRGVYAWPDASADPAATPLSGAEEHRRLVLATLPLVAPDAVVSHLSAAVLHGLPVWTDRLTHVQVTRPGATSGSRRGYLHVHVADLDRSEVTRLQGTALTSLPRTIADLGRSLTFEQAVAAGDAALRSGMDVGVLAAGLNRARGRRGVAAARRVARFLDGRSESPGESLSRVLFHRMGLPPPTLQYDVFDDAGFLVGRSDFCWETERTLGEFDGKVKYGPLVKPGESSADVLYREKRREDALRDLGWQVVRWSWADLRHEQELAERLSRAFRRGMGVIAPVAR